MAVCEANAWKDNLNPILDIARLRQNQRVSGYQKSNLVVPEAQTPRQQDDGGPLPDALQIPHRILVRRIWPTNVNHISERLRHGEV